MLVKHWGALAWKNLQWQHNPPQDQAPSLIHGHRARRPENVQAPTQTQRCASDNESGSSLLTLAAEDTLTASVSSSEYSQQIESTQAQ